MGKESIPKDITDLAGAIEWIKESLLGLKTCKCPVCGQTAKLYGRKLAAEQARFLIDLYKLTAMKLPEYRWVNISREMIDKLDYHVSRDYAKLRFWGLLEKSEKASRQWRITPAGIAFVEGRMVVPQRAYIYNNHCIKMGVNTTDIKGALGAKFDVKELLKGADKW